MSTAAPSPVSVPRWRRFRFNLRTLLLLVAAIACWLGWGLHQVRERERVMDMILAHGGLTYSYPEHAQERLSLTLWLLGAERADSISVPSRMYLDEAVGPYRGYEGLERIAALFPEAEIWIGSRLRASDPSHRQVTLKHLPLGTSRQRSVFSD